MLNPDGTKHCPTCDRDLPVSDFYKTNRKTGDGYSGYCKPCTKAAAVEWQRSNPAKMAEKWSRDYSKRTPQQRDAHCTAMQKRWASLTKEEKKAKAARDHARAKERDLARFRARTAVHNNRQRCRKLGIPSNFLVTDWDLLIVEFASCCAWCGTKVQMLDLDHIIPISKGGHDVVGNLVPVCRPCNAQKGSGDPHAFAKLMNTSVEAVQRRAMVRQPFAGHGYDSI